MDEMLKRIFDELASLRKRMATKDDIASIEQRMATKDDIAAMDKRIGHIEQTMATKDDIADLPLIKQAVFEILEAVNEIPTIKQNLADMSEKLEDVIATQARHELAIQSLAVRSLVHENEIRALKAK
ncbi:hypothetical protein [Anoxybacillus flavithermus]|uniref:ATPase component of ABC transporter with duplicated ATPase domain n=1 Tax=Anoxybacillus flavithermus TaxID=33934 RepID=A0A178TA19_9BACL|nr:hypothetical protein [Anoxybacillus flavithermus]OAO78366.1 ATPase component of ABC transporter with duplicated ATPase domain [Anoxybacillus flavithermus]